MLKRVGLDDLEKGMFVTKMEGSWFNHPFWKSQFMIDDAQKLQTLRKSSLTGVVIDTDKGKDVVPKSATASRSTGQTPQPERSSARLNSIKQRQSVSQKPIVPVSTDKEVKASNALAGQAKDRMQKAFLAARLGKVLNVRAVQPIVSDICASVQRNSQAFNGLMRCKLRNELTYNHALAVSALMISLGYRMRLDERAIHQAGLAGMFLDIGTSYYPKAIQPEGGDFRNLDPNVWEQHVMLGFRALQNDDALPEVIATACLQHHERMDGTGFPNGIAGEKIEQIARMAAICDTFDFLITPSAKQEALDPAHAVHALKQMEGAFDKEILRHFIESVGLFPVGSFVRLRSDKLAMVVDEDKKDWTKPIVQAFHCLATNQSITPHMVFLAKEEEEDEIVNTATLDGLNLPDEDHLREMIFLRAHKIEQ